MTNNDFKFVKLIDLCIKKPEYGSGSKASEFNSKLPRYVRITDINEQGYLKNENLVSPENVEEKYFLEENDLLFARSGSVGKTYLYNKDDGLCQFAGYLIRFKLNLDLILPEFLFYYTKSKYYWNWIETQKKTVTISNINAKQYSNLPVPLIPLDLQKEIVRKLKRLDELIGHKEVSIRLLDEYITSSFIKLFGNPITNSFNWTTMRFEDVGSIKRGKSKHRPRNDPILLGGKYPLIQTGDVASAGNYIYKYNQTYSEVGFKQSKMWPINTLCITIAANIAETTILTFESCFPDSIVGFIPNEHVVPEYVQYWLKFLQKILEEQAPQSAQKNINLKILSKLEIPVPPIELQTQFADLVKQIETLKKQQLKSKCEIENLIDSVMKKTIGGYLC